MASNNSHNDVLHLIDMLYETVDEAKSAAFSSDKCIVSRNEVLDMLGELRAQLPGELKKAQELIRARDEYVEAAKREADNVRRKADLDAKTIVSESRITQSAREKGHEIVRRAEERARNMLQVTNEYTEDALRRTEEAIQMALQEMQEARSRYRAASNERMQEVRRRMEEDSAAEDDHHRHE